MAESQKKDSSSVSLKEKNSLLDLDIGKDFLSSWKSMSIPQGDEMDFDLTPVTKGNKKSFEFDKADMDFNLDGDFGKIPSFNMDISDLDISPPLKKDGKSKEKPEESFAGKDKGKNDRFAFAFDFDELENFSFDSSLTKEEPKAQKDKNNKGSSPNGSGCQDKEGSMHMNLLENVNNLEDRPMKPSLPGTKITFDMDSLVGGTADLESTREICLPSLAMDDAVTEKQASAVEEAASGKTKSLPEATIASRELPKISPSEKLISPEPVDLQASTGSDVMQDLSSDYLSKNEPGGGNSSDVVDFMDTKATGSSGEKEKNTDEQSIAGSTSNYKHRVSDNSEPLQTFAISEKDDGAKSPVVVEDHVTCNRGRTELVSNSCTTSAVTGISGDTPSGREKQEPASEICKLPLVSQPADLSEKDAEKRSEPLVTCSRYFAQSEKTESPVQKALIQTTFSSLSSKKKMGLSLPSLVQGRDWDSDESDRKLVSLPLQHSKPPLRRELSQVRSQESCEGPKNCCDVPGAIGLQIGKRINDSSTSQSKDMVKTKSAIWQRETSTENLDTLSSSMEVNQKAAQSSGKAASLVSIPTIKKTADEQKLSSVDDSKKTIDQHGLKLSGLNLDSTKFPIQRDTKSVGNISRNRVFAHFPNLRNQAAGILSMKRKTMAEDAAGIIALHPSKRLSQSPNSIRKFVETSEKVLVKKVSNHNSMEDAGIKSSISNCQISTPHIPHDVKIKGFEMPFSIENGSNINKAEAYGKELDDLLSCLKIVLPQLIHSPQLNKLNSTTFLTLMQEKIKGFEMPFSIENGSNINEAEAYGKELDDLCNMLRKKHDEAKEILVRAIVNSNKLLLLNNPLSEEKIHAAQDFFARLTLNSN